MKLFIRTFFLVFNIVAFSLLMAGGADSHSKLPNTNSAAPVIESTKLSSDKKPNYSKVLTVTEFIVIWSLLI